MERDTGMDTESYLVAPEVQHLVSGAPAGAPVYRHQ